MVVCGLSWGLMLFTAYERLLMGGAPGRDVCSPRFESSICPSEMTEVKDDTWLSYCS